MFLVKFTSSRAHVHIAVAYICYKTSCRQHMLVRILAYYILLSVSVTEITNYNYNHYTEVC